MRDVIEDLARYADAATAQVRPVAAPEARGPADPLPSRGARRWGRWRFAAALAAVAVIAGVVVMVSDDGDEREVAVDTGGGRAAAPLDGVVVFVSNDSALDVLAPGQARRRIPFAGTAAGDPDRRLQVIGDRLVFWMRGADSNVWSVPVADPAANPLRYEGALVWVPDTEPGRLWILAGANTGNVETARLVEADGTVVVPDTPTPAGGYWALGVDGRLLRAADDGLWLWDPRTDGLEKVSDESGVVMAAGAGRVLHCPGNRCLLTDVATGEAIDVAVSAGRGVVDPAGRQAAVLGDGRIAVVDLMSGAVRELVAGPGPTAHLAWAGDDILAVATDGGVTLLDARSGRRLGNGLPTDGAVYGLAAAIVVDQDDGRGPATDELTVEPSAGLHPGDIVTVTGPFDGDSLVGAAQCGAEAVGAADPLPWCDLNLERSSDAPLRFEVLRVIATPEGTIDCAERPGRCVVGVRTPRGDLTAPISFDAALAPLDPAELRIDADDATVADGDAIRLGARGFPPGAEVVVVQCLAQPAGAPAPPEACDQARTMTVLADVDGGFERPYLAYRDILTYQGWVTCDPCVLRAAAHRHPSAQVLLHVEPDGPARRPQVEIRPPGPHEPGQRVTLHGSNFQRGGQPTIGWCDFRTDDPDEEVQGDGSNGFAPCAYPNEGVSIRADDAGRFSVDGFPLPDERWGGSAECADGQRCGLAWHPYEGSLPAFVTPFTTGG